MNWFITKSGRLDASVGICEALGNPPWYQYRRHDPERLLLTDLLRLIFYEMVYELIAPYCCSIVSQTTTL